ncbi:MAG TPA: 3-deoxy-7-phosphoheptulonate synthase [Candidatus Baltobacteraceae bacterium]|nr:3-deoxy-7-phosphoheptulonate synthase [Candidatus Baltobacteraceae bacterium]
MIAAYQGVDGAYSQLVLQQFLSERGVAEYATLGLSTYREVGAAVAAQRADVAAIPIENAIAGTVREGYDLAAEFGLTPVAEVLWLTDHRLLGPPGAQLRDVREVLAHPLTIAECSRFLASLPHARAVPCEDTGIAAREVSRNGNAAIAALASVAAGRIYGLSQLAQNCCDDPNTHSRFLIVAPPRSPLVRREGNRGARRTSLIFTLADAPGRLVECLAQFSSRDINVSKVESKPRLGHGNDHVFYVDVDGDAGDAPLAQALRGIERSAVALTVLGSYEAHHGPPSGRQASAPTLARDPVLVRRTPAIPAQTQGALPRVSRPARPAGSTINIAEVSIGDGHFTIIAGPCSVESREQVMETAKAVRRYGAAMLRGGAFKPRTSPYAFQGLGWEGVDLLAEAGRATGMPTVSEVMTIDQVERMARQIDVLQIGARNMQNFDLLKAVGRTGHPVLLKRGLSATLDELLAAAEYVLAEGNPNVILCERGIRTFENATRNTLDLSAVPVLRERSHLPVIVDPSHGVGVSRWIRPLCRAAKAVGAHGIIVEVHPNPAEAKSDKEQALAFEEFAQIASDLERMEIAGGTSVSV